MKKLRIGVVGVGKIGLAQIEAIKVIEGAGYSDLAAISSRDEAKARAVCAKYHIPAYFTDYRAMLAAMDLDVIHNCTTNVVHYAINRDIIESGCHVLSEKPLTVDSAQSAELVSLARTRRVKTAINFVNRHHPVIQQLQKLIASGWFGDIYAVHGSYLQDWLFLDSDYDWRVESRYGGASRAFADIGSHWIDMAQFLLGQNVAEVLADFATFIPVRIKSISGKDGGVVSSPVAVDTEDYTGALLRFDHGAHGGFVVSQVSAGRSSGLSFEIDGSKASVRWSRGRPNIAIIGKRGEPEQILHSVGGISRNEEGPAEPAASSAEQSLGAQKNMIDSFYRSILFGEAPCYADFEQGHAIVRIVEAALKSQRSRTWMAV